MADDCLTDVIGNTGLTVDIYLEICFDLPIGAYLTSYRKYA